MKNRNYGYERLKLIEAWHISSATQVASQFGLTYSAARYWLLAMAKQGRLIVHRQKRRIWFSLSDKVQL